MWIWLIIGLWLYFVAVLWGMWLEKRGQEQQRSEWNRRAIEILMARRLRELREEDDLTLWYVGRFICVKKKTREKVNWRKEGF